MASRHTAYMHVECDLNISFDIYITWASNSKLSLFLFLYIFIQYSYFFPHGKKIKMEANIKYVYNKPCGLIGGCTCNIQPCGNKRVHSFIHLFQCTL